MYRSTGIVRNVMVCATDGPFGKVDQFLFDSRSWAIRYIVVETGSLFTEEKKLLSPVSFHSFGPEGLRVNISVEQIRKSPGIDTEQPVSRRKELEIHRYYGWPYYWNYPLYTSTLGTPLYPGYGAYPYSPLNADRNYIQNGTPVQENKNTSEEELRSTIEVTGYIVSVRDRNIGNVIDFFFDDELWVLRYTVAETGCFFAGKRIVLASQWSRNIEWETKTVYFDIDPTIIERSPLYDTGIQITRDYETRLFDHYHKPYYW